MPSLAHLAAIERLSEELQGVRPGVSARKVALARPAPAPAAPRTHAALRAAVRPGSGRELAPRPLPSAAKRPRLPTTPGPVAVSHNVSTSDVIEACRAICARDPVVKGKRAALQATAGGEGITSALRDDVLRRWETCKLLALLPGLTSVSGASTYPANRDFEGSRWGVRGTAPQRFFLFFLFFSKKFIDFQEEECDILTKT